MGEEAAALFSSKPISFRMDRRSPRASKLKASVSQKLVEFLANYTDDVLAEYIVVLVCNGKHQNQARDDLEAFLGDDSEKFVAWLWQHLSEEIYFSKTHVGSSDLKADDSTTHGDNVDKEYKTGGSMDRQLQSAVISGIVLSKGDKYGPSNFSSTPHSPCSAKVSEDFLERSHAVDDSLAVVNTEDLRAQTCRINRIYGAIDEKHSEATEYGFFRVGSFSENSAGGEQFLQLEDSYQKMGRSKSNDPPRQPLVSPKREPVSRNLKSVLTEDIHSRPQSMMKVAGGRLSPKATDSVSHQNIRPRGSVWDRLGKPCEDTDVLTSPKIYRHGLDVVKRKKINHTGEGLDRIMPVVAGARLSRRLIEETAVLDYNCGKLISNNETAEHKMVEHKIDTTETCNDAVNFRRKRQFGEEDPGNGSTALSHHRDNHLQDKEAYQKLQRSSSLNQITAENILLPGAQCHSMKSGKVLYNSRPNEISQPRLKREALAATPVQTPVPVDSSLQSNPESLSIAECGNVNHKSVQDEVLDVKLRLRQVQREMLELRSKQVEMGNDTKLKTLLASGVRNHSEEDVESRTVFVTNVHFAAPKEALSSHFTQCGLVVRVNLLTDIITGQPKGSAYIVFAQKESVDKAISFSGTSFFSRTLKVMRKANMPAGILAPNQVAGKLPQPWHPPQTYGKSSSQRQFSSSHLQWRRDRSASGENSIASSTAE